MLVVMEESEIQPMNQSVIYNESFFWWFEYCFYHNCVFSRSDDVITPYSLLRDVPLPSILIENVALVVPQETLSFTIVSTTLLWAQSKKTCFWGSDDVYNDVTSH